MAGPIRNRRWLEDPVMTDDEVRAWVTGPRLSQGGRPIVETRTLDERIADMTSNMGVGTDVAHQNAQKIVAELKRRRFAEMGQLELKKQQGEAARQTLLANRIPGTSAQGPLGNILGFAGLPDVRPRIAGRKKTRKTHKPKRKTRKSRV